MKKEELKARLINACNELKACEAYLTDIDSKFGDADHGITMSKIADAITSAVNASEGTIHDILDDAAMAVMVLNGGSAVPLWNTWLDGLAEEAPESDEMSPADLIHIFDNALSELSDMSGAVVGDKTMMDAVIPATKAITDYTGEDESEILTLAAKAAVKGAEDTKNFVSKYGRAKSYGDKTIGTPDAGAVSMSKFFEGFAK